jgi:hypothetical protein
MPARVIRGAMGPVLPSPPSEPSTAFPKGSVRASRGAQVAPGVQQDSRNQQQSLSPESPPSAQTPGFPQQTLTSLEQGRQAEVLLSPHSPTSAPSTPPSQEHREITVMMDPFHPHTSQEVLHNRTTKCGPTTTASTPQEGVGVAEVVQRLQAALQKRSHESPALADAYNLVLQVLESEVVGPGVPAAEATPAEEAPATPRPRRKRKNPTT